MCLAGLLRAIVLAAPRTHAVDMLPQEFVFHATLWTNKTLHKLPPIQANKTTIFDATAERFITLAEYLTAMGPAQEYTSEGEMYLHSAGGGSKLYQFKHNADGAMTTCSVAAQPLPFQPYAISPMAVEAGTATVNGQLVDVYTLSISNLMGGGYEYCERYVAHATPHVDVAEHCYYGVTLAAAQTKTILLTSLTFASFVVGKPSSSLFDSIATQCNSSTCIIVAHACEPAHPLCCAGLYCKSGPRDATCVANLPLH